MGLIHARYRAGDADREQRAVIGVVDHQPIQAKIHALCRCQRCLLAEVEGRRVAIVTVVDHEPTAADIASSWPRDGKSEGRRHCSVYRVAALLQNIDTDLRGDMRGARHDAVLRTQRSATTLCEQRDGQQQGQCYNESLADRTHLHDGYSGVPVK